MGIISGAKKEFVKGDMGKQQSGFMTTTELAKLCGVSRFTVINWANQGKIKAIRTAGKHYRIPSSEALSMLRTIGEKKEVEASDLGEHCKLKKLNPSSEEECRNCLSDNKKGKQAEAKKRKFLYNFGYGIGRGIHILKERR
jgi:excisionase family DNA binding protein